MVPRSATQKLYTVPGLVELEARLLASANPAQRTAAILRSEAVDGVIAQRGDLAKRL